MATTGVGLFYLTEYRSQNADRQYQQFVRVLSLWFLSSSQSRIACLLLTKSHTSQMEYEKRTAVYSDVQNRMIKDEIEQLKRDDD